jgi:hypothetical protein
VAAGNGNHGGRLSSGRQEALPLAAVPQVNGNACWHGRDTGQVMERVQPNSEYSVLRAAFPQQEKVERSIQADERRGRGNG